MQAEPPAEVVQARRRHHAVIGDRGARVVYLNQQAGFDDGPVLDPHGVRDRKHQLLVVPVVFVPAIRDDAGGRGDRKEAFGDVDACERGLEIVDIAPERVVAGIGDRARRRPIRIAALPRRRSAPAPGRARRARRRTRGKRSRSRPRANGSIAPAHHRAPFEPVQPLEHVLRPAYRLAELAVADDVDPGLGLTPGDLGHRFRQHPAVIRLVHRHAVLLRSQDVLYRLRADQAPDMGGENAVLALLHPGSTSLAFARAAPIMAEMYHLVAADG